MKAIWIFAAAALTFPAALAAHPKNDYIVIYEPEPLAARLSREKLLEHYQLTTESLEQRVLTPLAAKASSTFWIVGGSLVSLQPKQVEQLKKNPLVRKIVPAHKLARLVAERPSFGASFTYGLARIGVPAVRESHPGLDGSGVRVGVIDTGADARRPDLRGKVVAFKDFISNSSQPYDDHSHGTHVAGTIAGGLASGNQIGVAPNARLVVAKVFSRYGNADNHSLLASLQWMADPDSDPKTNDAPSVINNSWEEGTSPETTNPESNEFCIALERLASLGIISVFAAGNDGPSDKTIRIPGSCPSAFTVAATNDEDSIVDFSSRGPVQWLSGRANKPDLAAPGYLIYSSVPGGGYGTKSGTSMAAPHVAGALALLLQQGTHRDVRAALTSTAKDIGPRGYDFDSGFGLVNLPGAVGAGF